jgi:hypothetical protein
VSGYHLAQLNIAKMRGAADAPEMAGFNANIARINALAERAPGFVWRWIAPEGDVCEERVFGPRTLVNVSVWHSPGDLRGFVFGADHLAMMRRRTRWFRSQAEAYMVLWWVASGHRPGLEEAAERLGCLRRYGPSACAFGLRDSFPPPRDRGSARTEV